MKKEKPPTGNQDPIIKELCDALQEGLHTQDFNSPRLRTARVAFYTKYGHMVSRRKGKGPDNGV